MKYLGIDIGGTAIKYALMNKNGELLSKDNIPTPKDNLESLLTSLDSIVLPVKEQINGIAISMPGRVDNQTGYVYTSGALSDYLLDSSFGELLSKRYQKNVAIENDGKCAAHAENWLGNLKDVKNGAVIIIGFGIGGGIVLNNQVWRGINGAAGEFSLIYSNYDQLDIRGVWAMRNGVYSLLSPYAKVKELPIEQVNGKVFFKALLENDKDAKNIFDKYISDFIAGILSVQAILDVEKYCIGGGISAQDILIDSLNEKISEYFKNMGTRTPVIQPKIERCKFKNDANLIGALKNYIDLYEKE